MEGGLIGRQKCNAGWHGWAHLWCAGNGEKQPGNQGRGWGGREEGSLMQGSLVSFWLADATEADNGEADQGTWTS